MILSQFENDMTCMAEIAPDNSLHFPHPCGADALMSWTQGCAGTTHNELKELESML